MTRLPPRPDDMEMDRIADLERETLLSTKIFEVFDRHRKSGGEFPWASLREWEANAVDLEARLERVRGAFQDLRDGCEHASFKLYRVLADVFPVTP